jgi:alanine dehydrogenase
MPAAYARTATQALANATYPFVELLADGGLSGACVRLPALVGGINVQGGRLTCPAVASAHGLPLSDPQV